MMLMLAAAGTLQQVASSYPDGFFTRYILLDHMDWMPMSMILDEWSVFTVKAAKAGRCRVLWRSYADEQHIAPLKYLTFHPEKVAAAVKRHGDRVFMYNTTHLATINEEFAIVPREAYAVSGGRHHDDDGHHHHHDHDAR